MSSSAQVNSRSNVTSMQQMPQHKRSLSFNHHLSYNQYASPNNSSPLNHSSPIHLRDKNVDQPVTPTVAAHGPRNNSKGKPFNVCLYDASETNRFEFVVANWSIVNLRPAPPLRPTLVNNNSHSNSTSSSTSTGGGTVLASTRKTQPTYEEDALVLRVIEAYCVAYQNPSRNPVHSGESFNDAKHFILEHSNSLLAGWILKTPNSFTQIFY